MTTPMPETSDRHSGVTPVVIDLISERTRAELEAAIDAPLTGEIPGRKQTHGPADRPGGED